MEREARMELRISLAGQLRLEVDGREVPTAGIGALGRLALGLLVLERHRPVSTDELARVLWGDRTPPTWRTAQRGVVSKLRVLLAGAGLVRTEVVASGAGWYQLCLPDDVVVDVEAAASSLHDAVVALDAARGGDAVGTAEARRAASAVLDVAGRPFLVGGEGEWVEARRAELAEIRLQALETLSGAQVQAGEETAALATAEQAVALEPLRESAHVCVMTALAAGGNRGAALRAYERCRRTLVEELGVGPSSKTERAYLDLLGHEPAQEDVVAVAGALPPLPIPLTSFVGRQVELAEMGRLLGTTRLLTLLGPGGVGKSRLALEAARAAADTGAVVLVELASVVDPQRLPLAVSESLGWAAEPMTDVTRSLVEGLARRSLLLVLDNAEHVLGPCAELARTLLSSCPQVRLLVTSRLRLGVAGETTWSLSPLALPLDDALSLEDVLACEAAALFVDRARSRYPELVLHDADAAALARLCRRLDGLPLAVELAAAHVGVLTVPEIAAGLEQALDLPDVRPTDGPARQRTLRTTLDWSYDRLRADEARLLPRLAVFSGGFTLDALRAVVAECGDPPDVYPALAGLVDASLVGAEPRPPVTRYGLLETVRSYALERLEASGEAPDLHRRHLGWATSLAERAATEIEGPRQREWLLRLDGDHANLSAALRRATSGPSPASALPLAGALGRYWEIRGHLQEGRDWLTWALAGSDLEGATDAPTDPARARALIVAAALAQRQGDDVAARLWLEESLVIQRRLADLAGEAAALHGLGLIDARAGDISSARSRYLNTLVIGRQLGDITVVATALANLGWLAQRQGDLVTAGTLLEESLSLCRALPSSYGMAWSLYFLGRLAEAKGDLAAARRHYHESMSLRRDVGDRAGLADVLAAWGSLAVQEGDLDGAEVAHEESLTLRRELGDRAGVLESLRHLGDVARLGGDPDRARDRYRESLTTAEDLGDRCCVTRARLGLARTARSTGAVGEAGVLLEEAAATSPVMDDVLLAEWLEVAASAVLGATAPPAVAARLLGAAGARREALGVPLPGAERPDHDAAVARVLEALGTDTWNRNRDEGAKMTPDAAVEEARRHLRPAERP